MGAQDDRMGAQDDRMGAQDDRMGAQDDSRQDLYGGVLGTGERKDIWNSRPGR